MADVQPGILAPLPRLGRYLNFSLKAGAEPRQTLPKLIDVANGNQTVVGLGQPGGSGAGKNHPRIEAFSDSFWRRTGFAVEDGITDALFKFTQPVSGSYFWCPPITGAKLDISALGL